LALRASSERGVARKSGRKLLQNRRLPRRWSAQKGKAPGKVLFSGTDYDNKRLHKCLKNHQFTDKTIERRQGSQSGRTGEEEKAGIRHYFIRPPIFSISRVPVALTTEPVVRKANS